VLLTLGARKYHHSIRRDNNICRSLKAMQWKTGRDNTSAVAGDDRVNPVVINIAIENFPP
jgi:hypothetical protein